MVSAAAAEDEETDMTMGAPGTAWRQTGFDEQVSNVPGSQQMSPLATPFYFVRAPRWLPTVAASMLLAHVQQSAHADPPVVIDNGDTVTVPSTAQPTPWIVGEQLLVGATSQGGTLTIEGGGVVVSRTPGYSPAGTVGGGPLSLGSATVTGAGSAWLNFNGEFQIGQSGHGALLISDGGLVRMSTIFGTRLGYNTRGFGEATVTGFGSSFLMPGQMDVGFNGRGRLNIADDANVFSDGGRIATNVNSIGDAMVTGGGTWTIQFPTPLTVGQSGAGSLTLTLGGQVTAPGGVDIAKEAGSTGVVNIGAPEGASPTLRGTLTTPSVTFGAGTGRLVFNHTDPVGNEYNFVPLISGPGKVVVLGGTTDLIANNTYTDGTTIGGGVLQISSDANLGFVAGTLDMTGGGILRTTANIGMARNTTLGVGGGTLDTQGFDLTMGAPITGIGPLVKLGSGTLVLTADNSYTGGTNIAAGALQLGNGGDAGGIVGDVLHNGRALIFDRSNELAFAGTISGGGLIEQIGSGTTILSGNSAAYFGDTAVTNGTLRINGALGNGLNSMTVSNRATLGGIGTIGGSVSIADGVLAPGNSPGTLTINGNLSLAGASMLNYEFGQAGVGGGALNDLTVVGGSLTLDGTLNVSTSAGGVFGPGLYRVISYGGALTDNGLALGMQPAGSLNSVLTAVPGQVYLLNAAGAALDFWDGAAAPNNARIDGGDGVWQGPAGNSNWAHTTGLVNGPYASGIVAVFAGTPGTVTVDNSLGAVVSGGMQFATSGYVVNGTPITLAAGSNILRVGDGTAPGASYVANINAALAGTGGIDKTDLGTLVLTGANSYTGGTTLSAGTLQVAADGNLGATTGALSFDGGTLRTTGSFTTTRATTLQSAGGTFETQSGVLAHNGTLDGAGALIKTGVGTLVLGADNTYTGGTTISAGRLQVGNGGTAGSIVGDVTNNASLVFNRSNALSYGGVISGSGSVTKEGASTLTLTGASNYGGGTTIAAGTLQIGNGGSTGSIAGDITNKGTLVFNRSDAITYGGAISGAGSLSQIGGGVTTLSGNSAAFSGPASVSGGALWVNGTLGNGLSTMTVSSGATLGGIGTFGGSVSVTNGVLAPGNSPGTLTIDGNLSLAAASVLDYEVGQSGLTGVPLNDLTVVGGNLTLDGTLNASVSAGGAFGAGLYRVISYGGTLTDNGLALGTQPNGSSNSVLTAVPGQVYLLNAAGAALDFWDGGAAPNNGRVDGGDGVWQGATGNNNWAHTTGLINGPYVPGIFAVFAGTPGTVTVDDSLGPVVSGGMQFATSGYVVNGAPITLAAGNNILRVGDGTAPGAGYVATINAALAGAGGIDKTDLGTLVLGGANSYAGGTALSAGTLQVAADGNLGATTGALSFNGGTLRTTGSFTTTRATTLQSAGGTFETQSGVLAHNGTLDGAGALIKTGVGTLVLGADNTYTGGTTISAGRLQVGNGGTAGSIVGDVTNNASLVFNRSNALSYGGVISGSGSVTQQGDGVLTLSGTNSYTGGTTLTAGTLQIAADGNLGATTGALSFNGGTLRTTASFTTARATTLQSAGGTIETQSGVLAHNGTLDGAGALTKTGGGTLVLGADNTYTGGTTISAGTLQVGNGGTAGSIVGDVTNNASLVFNRNNALSYGGVISGSGSVTKQGAGVLTLTGASSYGGGITIAAGTLQIGNGGSTGSIAGDITDNAALVFNRSDPITYGGAISGTGTLSQVGGGITTLSGNSAAFSGSTGVTGGTLRINGVLGNASSTMSVSDGGRLGGPGTIGGNVSIANGMLAPGNSPGTLTINGNLSLTAASVLNYEFGQAGVGAGSLNDLTVVGGSLTLDGTLNVSTSAGGVFGPGLYRVISYGGALTDHGLSLGTQPDGSTNSVQTAVAGQVNLINSAGLGVNFWDGGTAPSNNGQVNGGDGVWQAAAGNGNWTESSGAINAPYTDGSFAIFAGTPGTVTVSNSQGPVISGGMQFATNGYVIQGDPVTLVAGSNILRVGDGTAPGAGYVATIDAGLTGAGGIDKRDLGTLVLNGANSYAGGTTLSAGTLQVAADGNLGASTGALSFNGGTLRTTTSFTTARATTLQSAGGTIETQSGVLTHNGTLDGAGALTKTGTGTLVLGAANNYTGGTMLKGGQINVGNNTALGSGTLVMDEGTTLGFASDGLNLANAVLLTGTSDPVIDTGTFTETLSGVISGGGALTKNGSGTLVLAGVNSWTGATTVAAGTLRAGAANAFSAASSHAVAPGATLDTGGFNQRVAGLANSGTVSLVGANAGSTLTVTGPYVGNAGVLKLGTGLPASDRLVIDGATAKASGTTSVQIATLGALGAPTTGDGVELISARNGATTTAQTTRNAFSLAGGHVDAGAYEYRLQPGDARGAGENWYLRSTTTVLPPGESGTIPPVQVPTYRAEVPLLAALPGQLRQADLAMLGNLHRRMGDEAPGSWGGPPTGSSSSLAEEGTRRAWGRLVYSDLGVEQPGIAQARTDLRVSGFQAGTDLLVMDAWRAGVYVGYLDGNADVSGNAHGIFNTAVGSNDLNSRFLGAYATWMDASGWYFDSVLQGASHRYEVRPDGNPGISGKASGFMASVEGGKAFALTDRWSIEPQAQLAWQQNSFDDLLLSGARVQQDSASGWLARLGLRIKGDLATAAGRLQPYGRLNFYRANFGGDAALFIGPAASTVITSGGNYSAGEVAAGATLALNPATSLYGEIGHQWNIGGEVSVKSSVQGSLGIKVRW